VWPEAVSWIQVTQRGLHRELAEAMKAARDAGPAAAWALVSLSFLYGVFHAAGPGHGKMVISTYLVSHGGHLKRGLAISALSSLAQGVTAVVAVEITVGLLSIPFRDARQTTSHLELISFILVAAMGAWLVFMALRRLLGTGCHHHHHHDHRGANDSGADGGGIWQALAMIGSIGIRPCSGAILVLLFAHSLEMTAAGIGAVFAMSVGTGITVSVLAVLAVYARAFAIRFSNMLPGEGHSHGRIGTMVALAGGAIIFALGISLALSTWQVAKHPLL